MIGEEWLVYEENNLENQNSDEDLVFVAEIAAEFTIGALVFAISSGVHANAYRNGYEDGVNSLGGNESTEVQQFEIELRTDQ